MPQYLGIDTSNYTTSMALYNSDNGSVIQSKKLLPVKEGELGLRQSDAVFNHVKQLPEILKNLKCDISSIKAVGVSIKPRWQEGSYMPCFLVGEAIGETVSKFANCDLYKSSHQVGHILAALHSCGKLKLLNDKKPFLAFHVSGGTTDCLLVTPNDDFVITAEEIATSLDLKAGQLIDRIGLMLGLRFPCGKELEVLASESTATFNVKPTMKGNNCCLSGIENKCGKMLQDGVDKRDVALFTLKSIESAIYKMTQLAIEQYGDMPIVYAGGVMSDKLIRNSLMKFESYFAEPEFSCDNASGLAIYAAVKDGCEL